MNYWTEWPLHAGWHWMDDGREVFPVEVVPVNWHPSGLFPELRGKPLAGGQPKGKSWFTPAMAPDNSPAQQELPW